MDRSLCYKLWTAFSRTVDEATQFILKSNFSDTGTEHAVLLVLRLWYVSFNSVNVPSFSYLETKKNEHYLLDCLQTFWIY